MAVISDGQIAAVAKGAGLSGNAVAIAVAVALAESGGNPSAHNKIPPDNSYGLWQINMLGSLGPARRKQFGLTSNEQLFDPATNAKAMAAISGGGNNWKPWTTYTRGTYIRYMDRGRAAAGGTATPTIPAGNPVKSLGSLLDLIGMATDPKQWMRVGFFIAGMILVGLAILRGTTVDDKARGLAKTAAKLVVLKKAGG